MLPSSSSFSFLNLSANAPRPRPLAKSNVRLWSKHLSACFNQCSGVAYVLSRLVINVAITRPNQNLLIRVITAQVMPPYHNPLIKLSPAVMKYSDNQTKMAPHTFVRRLPAGQSGLRYQSESAWKSRSVTGVRKRRKSLLTPCNFSRLNRLDEKVSWYRCLQGCVSESDWGSRAANEFSSITKKICSSGLEKRDFFL